MNESTHDFAPRLTTLTHLGEARARATVTAVSPAGFELLEEIGRGGMGIVYRACDLTLNREVAVKVLQNRFEIDSAAARRFAAEASITAQLQHPGIPAVYQVGTLPTGRPYLAMKLIHGKTLSEYLELGKRVDAVSVFDAISQALGYAHAHGVIHRDLKPSNIMVGSFGEVQVMDWGIAKVCDQLDCDDSVSDDTHDEDATQTAIFPRVQSHDSPATAAGSVVGTLAYMPPEQAAGRLHDVSVRSDVFGLGAVLCVLLTGHPPFEGSEPELVRQNAATGNTAQALARLDMCHADPELVALCKRCLAYNPADRPASANEVARIVGELRAAAESRARQAEREILSANVRWRTTLRAAGVVAAVLALGVVGTTLGLLRANSARLAQAEQQKETLKQSEAATATVRFFEEHLLAAARPLGQQGGRGKDLSLRKAIIASLPALECSFPDQPLVEARLRQTLGTTFSALGDDNQAVELYSRARELLVAHAGAEHPDTLEATHNLAVSLAQLGQIPRAIEMMEATIEIRTRILGAEHAAVLTSRSNLANMFVQAGRDQDALNLREQVLAARRRVLPKDHADTLRGMMSVALSYDWFGRSDEAIALYEDALNTYKRILTANHPDTLRCQNNLAMSYHRKNRLDDAARLHQETLTSRANALPPDHPETLSSMVNLAVVCKAQHDDLKAVELLETALAGYKRAMPADHPHTLTCMNNLADGYANLGRLDQAGAMLTEVLAARTRTLSSEHPELLASLTNLAVHYREMHQELKALPLLQDSFSRKLKVLPPGHSYLFVAAYNLTECQLATDRFQDAIQSVDRYCSHVAGQPGVNPAWIVKLFPLRMHAATKLADPLACQRTAELWEARKPTDSTSLYDAACWRAVTAGVYAQKGQLNEASRNADRAIDWLSAALKVGSIDHARLQHDPDLEAIRTRPEFQRILSQFPQPAPPPRPTD